MSVWEKVYNVHLGHRALLNLLWQYRFRWINAMKRLRIFSLTEKITSWKSAAVKTIPRQLSRIMLEITSPPYQTRPGKFIPRTLSQKQNNEITVKQKDTIRAIQERVRYFEMNVKQWRVKEDWSGNFQCVGGFNYLCCLRSATKMYLRKITYKVCVELRTLHWYLKNVCSTRLAEKKIFLNFPMLICASLEYNYSAFFFFHTHFFQRWNCWFVCFFPKNILQVQVGKGDGDNQIHFCHSMLHNCEQIWTANLLIHQAFRKRAINELQRRSWQRELVSQFKNPSNDLSDGPEVNSKC